MPAHFDLRHTRAAIEAGTIRTGHCYDFTVFAVESLWAGARVVVFEVLREKKRRPLCLEALNRQAKHSEVCSSLCL